jgi:undecaprenyl-diphosphatase
MDLIHAVILGVVEGITEFLPVSSTGHLTITEKLLGYDISDPALIAFTAFIQVGATLATVLYFRKDLWRVAAAWCAGLFHGKRDTADYRLGWGIIIGSLPIAVIGITFKHQIETGLRSLWLIAAGLLVWSAVMYIAEKYASQKRNERSTTWRDTLFVGVMQCISLIPGVSRSGATISAGFFRGFDRVTATRLAFFLSIPALFAAGLLEVFTQATSIEARIGWVPTVVATVVSFIVAYVAVAWLLRFIAHHSFKSFIVYRVALGVLLVVLLTTGVLE